MSLSNIRDTDAPINVGQHHYSLKFQSLH